MGYVYILSNESMPGIVKVGSTDRTPEERLAELSAATGVPTPFELVFFAYFRDHAATEARFHAAFSSSRVNASREFFRIGESTAIDQLEEQLLEEALASVEGMSESLRTRLLEKLQHRYLRWKK